MESFDFDVAGRQKLEDMLEAQVGRPVRFEDIRKINVKEDMIVSLSNGKSSRRSSGDRVDRTHLPFDQLEDVARPACLTCIDFGNDYADLSVGGLGSPDGYTTVLVRTTKGGRIYGEALRLGYIGELESRDRAETRGKQSDIVDKVIAFSQRKRERGIARRRELGVSGPIEKGLS
jgi:coenzyme F420 hydrogenase subunit beta